MSLAEAQAFGSALFFGAIYAPERVSVVQVDGYSAELCGGTHVAATGQIGYFRITGESSIGTGLRRIEAVSGAAAEALILSRLDALHDAAQLLGAPEDQVAVRIEALQARLREVEKGGKDSQAAKLDSTAALAGAQVAGEAKVIVERYADADGAALRTLADDLRAATGRFVAVVAGERSGPAILVAASRDLVGEGFDAAEIIRQVAPLIGGGGGGRAELAQAGGKDAAGLDQALSEAARLALETLQQIENS
jgi:alanyl-tRNA synthetase